METMLPSYEGEADGHEGDNLSCDTPDNNLSPMPQMVDLSSSGLHQSPRLHETQPTQPEQSAPKKDTLEGLRQSTRVRKPVKCFGFFTSLLGASTVLWSQACCTTQVPLTVQNWTIYLAEVATALYDETINEFSLMTFAANQ
eukprot:15363748-Ditylum_brightwellii.AAC.1